MSDDINYLQLSAQVRREQDTEQRVRKMDAYEIVAWLHRLEDAEERLLAALEAIEGGSFDGASEMAVNGQWHHFATALQEIARAALALANEPADSPHEE